MTHEAVINPSVLGLAWTSRNRHINDLSHIACESHISGPFHSGTEDLFEGVTH
jgi:hypothetical protein